MKKIIFDNNGVLAVMIPDSKFLEKLSGTEEEKLIYVANKDLSTGTKYEIIDDTAVDLSDRTFRNAWEYQTGSDEKTSADLTTEQLEIHNMKENK